MDIRGYLWLTDSGNELPQRSSIIQSLIFKPIHSTQSFLSILYSLPNILIKLCYRFYLDGYLCQPYFAHPFHIRETMSDNKYSGIL